MIKLVSALILSLVITNTGWTMSEAKTNTANTTEVATFAGGCFWCMQPPYDKLAGVVSTAVGYTGGNVPHPSYEAVCSGKTGHAEAVQITYDPRKTTYKELLDVFWHNIDPTVLNGQFADMGSQYRTAIFYHSEQQRLQAEQSKMELGKSGKFKAAIVTEIVPATTFYAGEDYHQKYYQKNSLHYEAYSVGSGRKGFIKKNWGH